MESMTGFGESRFTVEGVQVVCSARSVNSRFLEVELFFPIELVWFRSSAEEIIRKRFMRGHIEVTLSASQPLPADTIFNTDLVLQYERFLAQQLKRKKVTLDHREYLQIPGFVERRVKDWRVYQNKFEFHLMRALIKMHRSRQLEGRRTTRACLTHVRYLTRILRRVKILYTNLSKKKAAAIRHKIYYDWVDNSTESAKSERSKLANERKNTMQIAQALWQTRKEEILRAIQSDATEELSRIAMHLTRMLEIFRKHESAGREAEFFLQELQREINTLSAKAQDGEINTLTVLMKTEVEKLREQVRNLE